MKTIKIIFISLIAVIFVIGTLSNIFAMFGIGFNSCIYIKNESTYSVNKTNYNTLCYKNKEKYEEKLNKLRFEARFNTDYINVSSSSSESKSTSLNSSSFN